MGGKPKLSQELVFELYYKNNLTPLEEYKNNSTKIKCINDEGYIVYISYTKLKTKRTPKIFDTNNPSTIYNIRTWTKRNKPQYILLSDNYEGNKKKLLWFCTDCNRHFEMTWDNFKNNNCPYCKLINQSIYRMGKNNPNWKKDSTWKDRERHRNLGENKDWIYAVNRKSNGKCVVCHKRKIKMIAHHLDGYGWCIEKKNRCQQWSMSMR